MHKLLIGALLAAATPAVAETAPQILSRYEAEARAAPAFSGFSVARGERFFKETHGGAWSCASCHGAAPTTQGRHAKTGKPIAPLAPSASAERFTDRGKVEKWFQRNCNDVLARACTAQEKGDVMAFLLQLGK